jgi:hypothetical protein
MAKYNADVSLARVAATSQSNQALYGAFVDANQITSDVAVAGMNAAGNVDYSGFINGLVTLGTTGMTELGALGSAGFDSNVSISNTAVNGLVDLGTAGLDATTTLGTAGITGVSNVAIDGFDTILTMDQGNNDLMSTVWTDYTTAIQNIMDSVPQLTCTVTNNADGTSTVSCTP